MCVPNDVCVASLRKYELILFLCAKLKPEDLQFGSEIHHYQPKEDILIKPDTCFFSQTTAATSNTLTIQYTRTHPPKTKNEYERERERESEVDIEGGIQIVKQR